MYVLNLAEDGRVLSIGKAKKNVNYGKMLIVDKKPEDNIRDYLFVDGEFIHNPLPDVEDYSARLGELHSNLQGTIDDILKIVEGQSTLAECAEVIKKRAEWRKELKEIESKMQEQATE